MVRFANKALVSDLYSGKNVLIFGLGRFGGQIAAARYFAERGARVTATDLKPAAELEGALADLEGLDVRFVLGHHETRDAELADLCCVSPAVPQRAPLLEVLRGRGVPLVTEVGLFLAQMSARPVCVTGSNGKTTTVSMLGAAMATDTSRANFVGGNVGRSLLPAVSQIRPSDHVLLELSSFQLDQLSWGAALRPRLALVTNLSPNHLDRHGSMESYLAAKRSLIEAVPAGGTVVLNRDDTASFSAFRRSVKGSLVTFGESADFTGPGTFVRDGQLLWRDAMGLEQRLIEAARIALPGAHNRANALAACAAAMVLGLGPAAFEAIAGFAGLPHRMEHLGGRLVAGRRKVSFVNDSKATTTEATLSALTAYPKVVYLGGGADKGVGF
ncbi:MAG: UDP-N-acetylmuramoyl-L-alanine--D-glutamate ligase, partial [Planctomycetota bacterium]